MTTRRGAELDLLLLRRGLRWGFEFKCTDAPRTTKATHVAIGDLGLEHLWVVYPGTVRYPMADRITALPLASLNDIDAEADQVRGAMDERSWRRADSASANVSSVEAVLAGDAESRPRSYYLVESKQRNHQAWFSSRTKSAYGYRCAFSGLPLRNLLVGAHIVPDAEDGPASVANGICMSTLHHTAFDTHLIGVDPDLRIHVAQSVFEGRDGPLLESLKALASRSLRVPDEGP